MKYYSPSTQGFYDKEVHDVIPEDSVEITDEYWESLLGNEIGFDGKKPIIKVYTEEELAQQELNIKLSEAKSYLSSTDWYYARKAETGEDVPADVVAKRIEYREFIRGEVNGN